MSLHYPTLFLKSGRDRSLRKGHPWIFSGAVKSIKGNPQTGEVVVAADEYGKPLALGFYNDKTDIVFRLLTNLVDEPIDEKFWRQRIRSAYELRKKVIPPATTAYRLINAEGDNMPGLVVDCYGDYLVIVISTAGIEKYRDTILRVLINELEPRGIYEKNEERARQREGLAASSGLIYGEKPPDRIEIIENGLFFEVDVVTGQKTGFFLDQRVNRARIGEISRRMKVLNCFSYTGAFSVYCARGGAVEVTSVEASAAANEMCRHNLSRNGISPDQHPVIQADVFSYLRDNNDVYDLIILDPPAFAKTKKDVARSARGYKDVNLQAARHLNDGGFLATFSCSNHIEEALFEKIVMGAVHDAGKTARLIERFGPGGDHPVNLAHLEGRYLKGLFLSLSF